MTSAKILWAALAVCGQLCACVPTPPVPEDPLARAEAIHGRVITLDTHVDIPFEFASDSVDPGVRGPFRVDLPKMTEGGLDGVFWIVYVRQTQARDDAANAAAHTAAMVKFDAIHRATEQMYPDQVELAYTTDDVERIHAAGKRVATTWLGLPQTSLSTFGIADAEWFTRFVTEHLPGEVAQSSERDGVHFCKESGTAWSFVGKTAHLLVTGGEVPAD